VGPLVLIVDDSEQNRKLASDVLRAAGLRTIAAATGAEGIVLATEKLPDVVLLDLRLGDMEGTEVASALGDDARTASIPIVALSALQPDSESLQEAGFAGSLEKPIDVRAFPDQVRRYCAR
jgi:two-component system cell cycle response regulator DivK